MTPFEYVLALISVLVGLAVADLVVSLHQLLRARAVVVWHWLPVTAGLLVLLLILNFWWTFYAIGQLGVWQAYWAFLVLAAALVNMFLLASAALPDTIPASGLDLRQYYDGNRRYFWILFSLFLLLATAVSMVSFSGRIAGAQLIMAILPNLVLAGICLALAYVRSLRLHMVAVPLLLVLLLVQWSGLRLE